MTMLDDDVDDLLQAFRADEAHLDDATRARMWDRICEEVPDAPAALDGLIPFAGIRRLRHRLGDVVPARVLGIAAAVLVLLAVAGVVVTSGTDDDTVTAGPSTTAPLPRTLQELADVAAGQDVVVLGSSDEARFAYQRYRTTYIDSTGPESGPLEELWVAADGSGLVHTSTDGGLPSPDGPGTHTIGGFAPELVLALPDDPQAVAALFDADPDLLPFGRQVTPAILAILSFPGLPAPARAGLLRALDLTGFVAVPAPDLAPNLMRVEGPGPGGSTMQAVLDLPSGEVISSTRSRTDGTRDVRDYLEVRLRGDIRGS